jgi:hypothetical protein
VRYHHTEEPVIDERSNEAAERFIYASYTHVDLGNKMGFSDLEKNSNDERIDYIHV